MVVNRPRRAPNNGYNDHHLDGDASGDSESQPEASDQASSDQASSDSAISHDGPLHHHDVYDHADQGRPGVVPAPRDDADHAVQELVVDQGSGIDSDDSQEADDASIIEPKRLRRSVRMARLPTRYTN